MSDRKLPAVDTLDQAEAAYGGQAAMARAFWYDPKGKGNGIAMWKTRGVPPRSHLLGLYLGLMQLGYRPTPKLFGISKWSDMPGWPTRRPKAIPVGVRKR